LLFDGTESLKNINLIIQSNTITVLFAQPEGENLPIAYSIGKRLGDVVTRSGRVLIDGMKTQPRLNVIALRRRGMVFARPVVLPFSIRENNIWVNLAGIKNKHELDDLLSKVDRRIMG
jgi:ABC-type phosphate transport system ATPase subunit